MHIKGNQDRKNTDVIDKSETLLNLAKRQMDNRTLNELVDSLSKREPAKKMSSADSQRKLSSE